LFRDVHSTISCCGCRLFSWDSPRSLPFCSSRKIPRKNMYYLFIYHLYIYHLATIYLCFIYVVYIYTCMSKVGFELRALHLQSRHTLLLEPTSNPLFFGYFRDGSLVNYMHWLVSNHNSPDVRLPRSWDYRCEPLVPGYFIWWKSNYIDLLIILSDNESHIVDMVYLLFFYIYTLSSFQVFPKDLSR
jgi:hypothetical protein